MLGNDSSSNSSSTTNNTTNNIDQRQVNDASNGGTVVSGSNNAVSTTDHGAVNAGVALGMSALNKNAHAVDTLVSAMEFLASQNQSAFTANQQLTKDLASTAQTAYADATAQAAGNKNIVLAGLVVVAIVGAMALKK